MENHHHCEICKDIIIPTKQVCNRCFESEIEGLPFEIKDKLVAANVETIRIAYQNWKLKKDEDSLNKTYYKGFKGRKPK